MAINGAGFKNYDGQKFQAIGDEPATSLSANVVLESWNGVLWGGTDTGLSCWETNHFNDNLIEGSNALVISLAEDAGGRLWMGTAEHGLWNWKKGRLNEVGGNLLEHRNLYALAADRDGQIWVGTGQGLFRYSRAGQLTNVFDVGSEVRALLVDRHGVLWIGTTGEGLVRYQNGVFTHFNKLDGLAGDFVTALFEDAEGSLWVGTRDGLSQLTDLKFPTYSAKSGLSDGSATSVSASKNGGLWITTAAGLSYFDGTNDIRTFTNNPHLSPFYLKMGFEARNGDFYMVDGGKSIDVLSNGVLTATYTNSIWVDALGEDAESVLIGIGSGLHRIEDGKVKPYQYQDGLKPAFYWINQICTSRDGAIWVASNDGIFRVWQGTFKHWLSERSNCLYEDDDGTVWAGLENGIVRIKDDKFKRIGGEDGIFDDRIYGIVPDGRGYLWFNSGNGIFRISLKSLNGFADGKISKVDCEAFAGLDSVKFTDRVDQAPSGCRTADGRIWFPNPHGVAMIDPGHYFTNSVAPQVAIQRILVNGQVQADHRAPVLHAGDKEVEFDFSALSFISPKKMQVLYQLSGVDTTWVEAGTHRSAKYDNLSPGDYTFKIRAGNADDVWSEEDSISFNLPSPFYQTLWFKSGCVLGAVLLLFSAYRWKVRLFELHQQRLQVEKDQLEAKVTARTAELSKEIAERRQTEEQLRRSQTQLAQAQQIARMGSWEWDLVTNLVSWSKQTQELYGWTPGDVGKSMDACVQDRIHPDDRELVNQTLAEAVRTGKPFASDHRVILPDGQERIMHGRGEILVNAQGQPVRLFGIVQDITDARRAEEALQRSEEQLRQAQKMEAVGRLAGGVAHDFNNLLTVIDGYCAIALQKVQEVLPIKRNLEEIQKAAGRAASLTNQLLAFSRKQVLQPRVIQLNDVVASMDKMLRRLIGEDIELLTAHDPVLGNTHADPGQIEQVIMNLAVNARDAMPRGGRLTVQTANVTIDQKTSSRNRIMEPGEYVMIAISDTGVGMTDEVKAHLFEPFYTTKGLGKGTGLGLATCYGIISQSDGDIRVYSEPNQGTTFKIYLPRTDAILSARSVSPLESLPGGTESILVVEDDSSVRLLAVTILRGCGYQVQEASNAFDALALLKRNSEFDLVISDVIMPQMSGKDLMDEIHRQLPQIKVMLMSGYTDDALAHRGVLDESLSFLEKPFSPAKLAQKVREVLNAGGAHRNGKGIPVTA